jgi:23S rRNA (uracil1939-C5)-methyltransferase/tRNA (uracil-5-)-methyltransferase
VGVEICPTAVQMARLNATTNGLQNAQFLSGDAEAIFSAIQFPPNEIALVLDPPRAGCSPSFLKQLLRFAPGRVIYVSCDPQTQVRDIRGMLPHYRITAIQPFDLFPQTKHGENVVTLIRNK